MSYESRVRETAERVKNQLESTPDSDPINVILWTGISVGAAEASGKMRPAQKDFVKDVIKDLKAIGYKKPRAGHSGPSRSPSGEKPIMRIKKLYGGGRKVAIFQSDINALDHKIHQAIGQTFPDAEPDYLISEYFENRGWDNYESWDKLMPYLMKKFYNCRSLDDYMRPMWQEAEEQRIYDGIHNAEQYISSNPSGGMAKHYLSYLINSRRPEVIKFIEENKLTIMISILTVGRELISDLKTIVNWPDLDNNNYLNDHKKEIITDLLKTIKKNHKSITIKSSINGLKKTVDWPELDIIIKSLVRADQKDVV